MLPRYEEHGKDYCIALDKCIYGLIQTMRQYYKNDIEIWKKAGFSRGNVGLCIYKKSTKGIVYIGLYVDDNLMVGNSETIDQALESLQKHGLVLKVMEGLQDYS